MVMDRLPEAYKSLKPFLKIAEDMSGHDVAVEYWCLHYVFREALRLDRTSPECQPFTAFLFSYLKKLERETKVHERFTSQNVAQKYMKSVALNVFQEADKIDRSGKFSITVVKLFIRASNLINVLTVLGDLDDSLIEARKYARWRGAYIFSCLNNGEKPLPAPEEVNELLDQGKIIIIIMILFWGD
ncbi:Vacuolar protein sorting-associated protein VTA1 -like protein [Trichinella zimbabwensis]|uniref:Vacuolar protein sorting-associated protein VTA1-like protein n=1 Tax=Trichinella zimbabwensis TaxID=268475 RepID=A0A0V1GNI5_9BILA|nr:Vacuolar protein sorting-associated protein VTA1 -like protein [Trichinella zimbabwensis]